MSQSTIYDPVLRERMGLPPLEPGETAPSLQIESTDGGDWWTQNNPVTEAAQRSSGGYSGAAYSGDPETLVSQYYASNPYGGSITGLYDFLKQNGVTTEYVDHRGQPSADKLWINGRMVDVVGSSDSPDAHWAYTDVTDQHNAAQSGSMGGSVPAGAFGSLAQGWNSPFSSSAGNFQAPGMDAAMNSPGFQFRLKEGLSALERSAAAKGTLLTGGTLKDLNSWAQDYASNEYDKVYNRALGENQMQYGRDFGEYGMNRDTFWTNQNNQYSRYMGLAGLGQQAAGQLGAYGSSYMNQGNDLMTGSGNAQAAGTIGSTGAYAPLYGGMADIFNQYWQSKNRTQPVYT